MKPSKPNKLTMSTQKASVMPAPVQLAFLARLFREIALTFGLYTAIMCKHMTCTKHRTYKGIRQPRVKCDTCWKMYASKQVADSSKSRGRARGGGRSSKAKGRNAVLDVQRLLLSAFHDLGPADVVVKATSQGGCDIHLSEKARELIHLDIEVKACESLNVWSALKQAEVNSERSGLDPILFFKRAFTEMYVAMPAAMFLKAWASIRDPYPNGLW